MLIPHMFCTLCKYLITTCFLFLRSKSMTFSCGLLKSIYTTTRLIYFQGSNLIASQDSKIIPSIILEPSTAFLGTAILRVCLISILSHPTGSGQTKNRWFKTVAICFQENKFLVIKRDQSDAELSDFSA